MRKLILFLAMGAVVSFATVACGESERKPASATPEPSLNIGPGPSPTPSPSPAPPTPTAKATVFSGEEIPPPPPADAPCPVSQEICDAAISLAKPLANRDSRALFEHLKPRTLACPKVGEPFPIISFGRSDLCDNASPGDVREYLIATSAGEGAALTPEAFKPRLEDYLQDIPSNPNGLSADRYGPPQLVLGGIGCRVASDGTCADSYLKFYYTARSDAFPLGRTVYCLEMWRPGVGEAYGIAGFGCGVPPLVYLTSFTTPMIFSNGDRGTFTVYPWSPR